MPRRLVPGLARHVRLCAHSPLPCFPQVESALDLILKQLNDDPASKTDFDKVRLHRRLFVKAHFPTHTLPHALPRDSTQADIVQALLKHKKARPDEWTSEIDSKCKQVIGKI